MKFQSQLIDLLSKVLIKPTLSQHSSINHGQVRESSVAIIFRNTNKQNAQILKGKLQTLQTRIDYFMETQILFLQRVINQKPFSGDVCLPGGKVDENETPFQAAIRQTKQQTGLQLDQSQFIGMVNNKFIAFQANNFNLYAYAFVFFTNKSMQIKLNYVQMSDFKWVPLKHFLNQQHYTFQKIPNKFDVRRTGMEILQKYITHIEWPSIQVGLSKSLYGLTLYILGYFVNRLVPDIVSLYIRFCQIEEYLRKKSTQSLITAKSQVLQSQNAVITLPKQCNQIQKYVLWQLETWIQRGLPFFRKRKNIISILFLLEIKTCVSRTPSLLITILILYQSFYIQNKSQKYHQKKQQNAIKFEPKGSIFCQYFRQNLGQQISALLVHYSGCHKLFDLVIFVYFEVFGLLLGVEVLSFAINLFLSPLLSIVLFFYDHHRTLRGRSSSLAQHHQIFYQVIKDPRELTNIPLVIDPKPFLVGSQHIKDSYHRVFQSNGQFQAQVYLTQFHLQLNLYKIYIFQLACDCC